MKPVARRMLMIIVNSLLFAVIFLFIALTTGVNDTLEKTFMPIILLLPHVIIHFYMAKFRISYCERIRASIGTVILTLLLAMVYVYWHAGPGCNIKTSDYALGILGIYFIHAIWITLPFIVASCIYWIKMKLLKNR